MKTAYWRVGRFCFADMSGRLPKTVRGNRCFDLMKEYRGGGGFYPTEKVRTFQEAAARLRELYGADCRFAELPPDGSF